MKWKTSIRLAQYFGIISDEEADEWVDPEEVPFHFEFDEEGRLWAIPKNEKVSKKRKPSN